MRILIFNHIYYPYQKGGAEISTQLLAESLIKMGHEVHVCTTNSKDTKEVINGVMIHRIRERNVYWSYKNSETPVLKKLIWHIVEMYNIFNIKVLYRVIKSVNPDVIHTNVISGFSTIVWKIAHLQKIPIVHTLRDYYLICAKATMFNGNKRCEQSCNKCRCLSYSKRLVSANVDAVVGISVFILQKHIDKGYFENSRIRTVIKNPVKHFDRKLTAPKRKVIGYLGRIHPSKGIEILLSSFLRLSMNEYSVEVAGEGNNEYVSKLKQQYCINDKIKFIGKVEPYNFLSTIEVLVVPSLWDEPFGRVVVEANSCGCPVIVSNRGGMPELIKECCNGLVFDIDDKDSLKNMLNNYIRGKISFSLGNIKLDCYNEEFVANQYVNVYQKVMDSCKS